MSTRGRMLAVGAAGVASVALAAGLLLGASDDVELSMDSTVPVGQRRAAPELEGEWLVPPPVSLAALRGTPVLINFWASWCVPCREEAPELARFDRELRHRARLVGVDYNDAKGVALQFVREFGWRFPIVADPRGTLAGRYRLIGLPTTFVLDREGRIARSMSGAQTFETLRRAVEEVE